MNWKCRAEFILRNKTKIVCVNYREHLKICMNDNWQATAHHTEELIYIQLNLKYVCHVIKVISNDTDQYLLLNSDKSIYQV